MNGTAEFQRISPTTLADVLGREQVMDRGIRPLWGPMPRVAGAAFTVRCPPADNLMLHAAVHRAEPGSIIVVQAGDADYAVAGGNVCAVAQRRGIAAFVVDGVIRDIAEMREMGFPVFSRGVMPIPGAKNVVAPLNKPVTPSARCEQALNDAHAKLAQEAGESLEAWEAAHRSRIDDILAMHGFAD